MNLPLIAKAAEFVPEKIKNQFFVNTWSFFNVPMLFWVRPKIVELSKERIEIKIPLNKRTKNHLNSMYFGVLSTGADCAGGLLAMKVAKESGQKVSLVFKDFHADFLKRAEGDTFFCCEQGVEIREFVEMVINSEKRHHRSVKVQAKCLNAASGKFEIVANFKLTLSMRCRVR